MSGFDINQLTISGNLTRQPELRHTTTGTAVCNIRIAHNERRKTSAGWIDQPQYFDVTIWSGLGAWVAEHVAKGAKVVVAGRLRWREYTTADGDPRQSVEITADSIVPVPARRRGPDPTDEAIADGRDDLPADDDDIPF